MKENLRTTHYANGGDIDLCLRDSSIYYTAHYFYPDNNSSNVSMAGLLYNQHAIMHGASCSNTNPSGVQGICPIGWHLPSNAEWEYMINYIGSQTQYLCGCDNNIYIAKSIASSIGWINGNFQYYTCSPAYDPSTNNSTGFSMFPAGTGTGIGFSSSSYFGLLAEMWSVSGTYDMLTNTYEQYMFGIGPYQGDAIIDHSSVGYAIGSVRCLKN